MGDFLLNTLRDGMCFSVFSWYMEERQPVSTCFTTDEISLWHEVFRRKDIKATLFTRLKKIF